MGEADGGVAWPGRSQAESAVPSSPVVVLDALVQTGAQAVPAGS